MRGKKAVKVIISAYEFINNKLNLSPAKIKSLPKKFDEFAADNSINVDDPYMGFDTYSDFKDAAIEFVNYRNIDNNRLSFMKSDYGIINKIYAMRKNNCAQKTESRQMLRVGKAQEPAFKQC